MWSGCADIFIGEAGSASFNQTVAQEFPADRALVCCEHEGKPVLAVVLEVQRQPDDRKHRAWPLRGVGAICRTRLPDPPAGPGHEYCDGKVGATADPRFHPTSPWSPLVLGPDEIPASSRLSTRPKRMSRCHCCRRWSTQTTMAASASPTRHSVGFTMLPRVQTEAIDRLWWMLGLLGGIVTKERFTNIQRLIMLDPSTPIRSPHRVRQLHLYSVVSPRTSQGEAEALLAVLSARGLEPDAAQSVRITSCQDGVACYGCVELHGINR